MPILIFVMWWGVSDSLTCYKYFHVPSTSQVGQGVTSFYRRTEECGEGVEHCMKLKGKYHLADFFFDFTRPYFDGGCGPLETTPETGSNSVSVACDFSEIANILETSVTAQDDAGTFLSFPLSSVFSSVAEYPYDPSDRWLRECGSQGAAGCIESATVTHPPFSCGREGFRPVTYEFFTCTGNLCNL